MIPTHCPKCGADFKGLEIPKEWKHLYGDHTHFSDVVAVQDGNQRLWHCPDCKHEWPRDEGKCPTP